MSTDESDFQALYDRFHTKINNYRARLAGKDKTGSTFYLNEDNESACDRKAEKPRQQPHYHAKTPNTINLHFPCK